MTFIGLDWIGLDWIGLDWIGLDWIELDWIGLDWIGLGWEAYLYRGNPQSMATILGTLGQYNATSRQKQHKTMQNH